MMNKVYIAIFLFIPFWILGQSESKIIEGAVSFRSSKNIYVKFESTEGIETGDTLEVFDRSVYLKCLVVKQKSSTSCVTENIGPLDLNVGDKVFFRKSIPKSLEANDTQTTDTIHIEPVILPAQTTDTMIVEEIKNPLRREMISGRLSLSTNSDIFTSQENFQRVRAGFSFNVANIRQSAFSTQTYLTFRRRYGIDQLEQDLFNDLKVFTMAVQYAPGEQYSIWLGRKMNQHVANIGAIDGLQAEYRIKRFTLGTFIGTRPDFTNFSFTFSLPQFGAYIVRKDEFKNGFASTTLAVAEQMNDFLTDRRFLYIQHNSTLFKRLNLFFSSELDLFSKVDSLSSGQFRLTSLYLSARYRIAKNLSLSTSYDNRRNVIYYESYQTLVEQLLAQETRHGLRFQANFSPLKNISVNASTFLRFQGEGSKPTTNYVLNVHINRLPLIQSSVGFTGNYIQSGYFTGTILGGRISNSLAKGKLNLELTYRNVNYLFSYSETPLIQHIAGTNVSYNLFKRTSLMLSYEATFDRNSTDFHRYYITFVQRFKN